MELHQYICGPQGAAVPLTRENEMAAQLDEIRRYLDEVTEETSWFCIVDDVRSIINDGPSTAVLPEFVTVTARTGTSCRWWCDECDWGGGWVSPREAWDGAYTHAHSRHSDKVVGEGSNPRKGVDRYTEDHVLFYT